MGKALVIVGADFSASKILVDLTPLFTFTSGYVLQVVNINGTQRLSQIVTSTAASLSGYIDVTAYRGKKIVWTGITWRSSGGGRPPWGASFYASKQSSPTAQNTDFITNPYVWYLDSGVISDGEVMEYEMTIPQDLFPLRLVQRCQCASEECRFLLLY